LMMALGIPMSPDTIRYAVESIGRAVVARQKNGDWEPELAKFSEAMKNATGPFTLESAIDGAMVPLNKKRKAEPESHKEARSVTASPLSPPLPGRGIRGRVVALKLSHTGGGRLTLVAGEALRCHKFFSMSNIVYIPAACLYFVAPLIVLVTAGTQMWAFGRSKLSWIVLFLGLAWGIYKATNLFGFAWVPNVFPANYQKGYIVVRGGCVILYPIIAFASITRKSS
jgi:hypothetical protein